MVLMQLIKNKNIPPDSTSTVETSTFSFLSPISPSVEIWVLFKV